jgi:hypothetical protein
VDCNNDYRESAHIAVFRIRILFMRIRIQPFKANADLDQAFYANEDPDLILAHFTLSGSGFKSRRHSNTDQMRIRTNVTLT